MTTNTPRTRKQLRAALHTEQNRAAALEGAIRNTGIQTRGEMRSYSDGITTFDFAITNAVTQAEHDKIVAAHRGEVEAATRRETLAKVIDALELTGYSARSKYTATVGADALWADINTALEVREAEKHAATQKRTAERVAGLTKGSQMYSFALIPAGSVPTVVDGTLATDTQEPKSEKKPAAKKETKK